MCDDGREDIKEGKDRHTSSRGLRLSSLKGGF